MSPRLPPIDSADEAAHGARYVRHDPADQARRADRLVRRRRETARELRDRHRAREDSLLSRDPRPRALCGRDRDPRPPRRPCPRDGLGPDPGCRQRHRPRGRGGRRHLNRAGRPVRALRGPAPGCSCHGAGTRRAPERHGARRRPPRHRLPRSRHEPEMDAGRNPRDAQEPLQDHGGLHAEGRQPRPRHDAAHRHRSGERRFLLGGRHGAQDARVARPPARRHRALCQFSLHGRPPERLPVTPLRDLARHRRRPHRHAARGVRVRLRLRDLCRLAARHADVLRQARRHLPRRLGRLLPRPDGRQAGAAPGRVRDRLGLGQPRLDGLPGGAPQALPRDARRRCRRPRDDRRAGRLLDRPALR
ncbi:hypothetical protein AEGHOMDF_5159 [Methylobacterium soli]|nr:hypothetical protein AEGHOMDF_5159 [Methylobacterium soli]